MMRKKWLPRFFLLNRKKKLMQVNSKMADILIKKKEEKK